jgi:hypothetical protein
MKALLRGVSQLLFVLAGLSFLVGGLAISILTKTDRISAEMAGIGVAVVFGILGFAAKSAGDNLVDGED